MGFDLALVWVSVVLVLQWLGFFDGNGSLGFLMMVVASGGCE